MIKEKDVADKNLNTVEAQDLYKISTANTGLQQNFKSLNFLGRLLIGIAFIGYGYSFFYYMQGYTTYISFLPFPLFWSLFTGTLILLSGILLILNIYTRKIALFLAISYSIITLLVLISESDLQVLSLNIAIIGGLLMVANNTKK